MASWVTYSEGAGIEFEPMKDGHKVTGRVVRSYPDKDMVRVEYKGQMYEVSMTELAGQGEKEKLKLEVGERVQSTGNPNRKGEIDQITQRTVYVKWSDGVRVSYPKNEVLKGKDIEKDSGETQEFKVGDRVKHEKYGDGTVQVIESSVGVEFDVRKRGFHNLYGEITSGRGYWVSPTSISKIEDKLKVGDKVRLREGAAYEHQRKDWEQPFGVIKRIYEGMSCTHQIESGDYMNTYPESDLERYVEEPEEVTKEQPKPQPEEVGDGMYGLLKLKEHLEKKIDDSVDDELKELREQVKKSQTLEVKLGDKTNEVKGLRHKQLDQLIKYSSLRLSPLLVGMAGTGKTHAGKQVAEALGLSFFSISVGAQTTKTDIMGYMDATGRYIKTHFREAYENGGVFLMDEIDAGNANVLITINAALSNDLAAFPDAMVERHPDFIFIASANTFGNGANRQYVGRNQLDAATLDRFAIIEWHIDDDLEENLSVGKTGKAWYSAVKKARDYVSEKKIRALISPRATQKGSKLLEIGQDVTEVIEATIMGSVPDDKKDDVRRVVVEAYNAGRTPQPSELLK